MSADIVKFPVPGTLTYEAALDALANKAIADALLWSQRQEPRAFTIGADGNLVLIIACIAADMLEVAAVRLRKEARNLQYSEPRA